MTQALLTRKPQGRKPQDGRPMLSARRPAQRNGVIVLETADRPLQEPDAFVVDRNLHSWASARTLARGVDCYRKGRVLSLESYENKRIVARVEGTLDEPYDVEVRLDPLGMPKSKCACPFNWEPLCKHAVAVLLAWQQSETGSEPALARSLPASEAGTMDAQEREKYLRDLADIERGLRRASALEQGLKIVDKPHRGPLGTYTVGSGNFNRGGTDYRVAVRDAQWEHATCQCLDFKTNELGTCKHIERVRHYLSARPRAKELDLAARTTRRLHAYLGPRDSHDKTFSTAEHVRIHIPAAARPTAPGWIYEQIDSQGWLRDASPTAAGRHKDRGAPRARVARVLERLRSHGGVALDVDPQIEEALRQEDDQSRWEQRLAALAKDPASSRAWSDSIGRMRVRLHPYQAEGILFAAKKRRAFIADDMGLGKTVQAIGAALLLKELGQARRVLVVTPSSLKFQWKQEIERLSDATVAIVAGSAKARDEQYRTGRAFFTLINYELLYRDLDQILALAPDMVILDEAQRIKNWETKTAQTIKRLKSPVRLVLTGTPLENRLPELLSISEFLDPRALGAPWKLVPTYAVLDPEERIVGYTRLDHLRRRMSKFLIRRTRAEVLSQLPKRTDNHYWTPITPEQAQVHQELGARLSRLINKWKRFKRLTREDIQLMMMLLTTMRIVCNAYGQYDWKAIESEVLTARRITPALKKKIGSPKLEEFHKVMSELLEDPTQKVVVFSQWERMLRLAELTIRDILESAGARSVVFCGSLPMKKRAEEVQRFLEDPSTRVFFSTDAGGVGLNLQHGANIVVNLDVPWNPAVLEQRVGRVYRMGQKKSVQAIHFISSECVEQGIFALVAQKKALFSGVFSEDAKEVRFTSDQAASFVEKMRRIVPESVSADAAEEPGAVVAQPEEEITAQERETAGDRVAAAAENPSGAPGMEFNLGPGMNIRMTQDQDGVHLTLPKQTLELLKGLAPLAAALAKIAAGG
ncbi:MAG: DEAD/DEAH box helicase family protein [Elusimicrobia bacterium]|nr:DEAD/DEAH box helicase family protein [Elusimicrobiota bacterium]